MANFTLIELHLEEASFSSKANMPFSGAGSSTDTDSDDDTTAATPDTESGRPGKGTLVAGLLVGVLLAAAAYRYLSGGDETPDVAIETADDDGPVGVTVDTDEE